MSENDFECLARTGVNAPVTMFPDTDSVRIRFQEVDFQSLISVLQLPVGSLSGQYRRQRALLV
jgi:hypothetical protein